MPGPFTITSATNSVKLDDNHQGAAVFTVFNGSGRPIRGQAQLEAEDPAATGWLSLEGEAEQDFDIAAAQQMTVEIKVPSDAPSGSYPFRLDMVGVENPDELYSEGPTVTFQVPEAEEKEPFPWWIVAVVAGVIVIAGIILAIVLGNRGGAEPTPTPTATVTPTPPGPSETTISFDENPDGTTITSDTILNGDEFQSAGILLAGAPQDSYCAEATATKILVPPHQVSIGFTFLTSSRPNDLSGCETVPVEITFVESVTEVTLTFAGASATYTMEVYDSAGNLLQTVNKDAVFGGGTFEISYASGSANIKRITFGRKTALTSIKQIQFEK
jgi:hypothetical protein